MLFAERLRELRDAAGLSEAKLATLAAVPLGTLHHYGAGQRRPSFDAVVKIAKALGTNCEAFADCSDIGTVEAKPAKKKAPGSRAGKGK